MDTDKGQKDPISKAFGVEHTTSGPGDSDSASAAQCRREPVITAAMRRYGKAQHEAQTMRSFLNRVTDTPGAAELLDLVQTAMDLSVINPRLSNW